MIWAALAAIIAAVIATKTGGKDEWKALVHHLRHAIKQTVKDKARQDEALAVVESANREMTESRKRFKEIFRTAYTVHRTYTSTLDDYLVHVDAAIGEVNKTEIEGLNHRAELQAILTPEELRSILDGLHGDVIKDDAKQMKKDKKEDKKEHRKEAKEERKAEHDGAPETPAETPPEAAPQ